MQHPPGRRKEVHRLLQELDPAHLRHPVVRQQHRHLTTAQLDLPQRLQRVRPRLRPHHPVPLAVPPPQVPGDRPGHARVVIHCQQHGPRHPPRRLPTPSPGATPAAVHRPQREPRHPPARLPTPSPAARRDSGPVGDPPSWLGARNGRATSGTASPAGAPGDQPGRHVPRWPAESLSEAVGDPLCGARRATALDSTGGERRRQRTSPLTRCRTRVGSL